MTSTHDNAGVPKAGAQRPAVFLDRDGVLMVDKDYLADPAGVELIPGVGYALRQLRDAGYVLVCVSNQSGVARGYFTEQDVDAVNRRLCQLLEEDGTPLDAVYYSPFHPEGVVEAYRRDSECRKPGPGMLLRAAREHALDLSRSYMIGDKKSDIDAASAAGVAGLLVLTGYGKETRRICADAPFFSSLPDAVRHILASGNQIRD